MDVVTRSGLSVASIVWQPRAGAHAITVVCKATFVLTPGHSPLAAQQDPVIDADHHFEDDEHRSLRWPSDLAPAKKRPEVFVTGHAFAAGERPIAAMRARISVGAVNKSIAVVGDRHFTHAGVVTEPHRFVTMPLRWERAAAGPSNPVGVATGPSARADAWGRVTLPSFFPWPIDLGAIDRATIVAPIGLSAIAARWAPRFLRLGRNAVGWDTRRWFARPLPDEFDFGYFQTAPHDQQLEEIRGTEELVLEGLHAAHAELRTQLQTVTPHAVARFADGIAQPIPLACDTWAVDSDRGVCTLTWRGHIPLDAPDRAGTIEVTDTSQPLPSTRLREGRGAEAEPRHAAGQAPEDLAVTRPLAQKPGGKRLQATGPLRFANDFEDPPTTIDAEVDIARCGTLAACLDARPADRAALLVAEGLSEPSWRLRQIACVRALAADPSALGTYDAAYAAAFEVAATKISAETTARTMAGWAEAAPTSIASPHARAALHREGARRIATEPDFAAEVERALLSLPLGDQGSS